MLEYVLLRIRLEVVARLYMCRYICRVEYRVHSTEYVLICHFRDGFCGAHPQVLCSRGLSTTGTRRLDKCFLGDSVVDTLRSTFYLREAQHTCMHWNLLDPEKRGSPISGIFARPSDTSGRRAQVSRFFFLSFAASWKVHTSKKLWPS